MFFFFVFYFSLLFCYQEISISYLGNHGAGEGVGSAYPHLPWVEGVVVNLAVVAHPINGPH